MSDHTPISKSEAKRFRDRLLDDPHNKCAYKGPLGTMIWAVSTASIGSKITLNISGGKKDMGDTWVVVE